MVPESDNRPVPLGRVVRGHAVLLIGTTLVGLLLGFLASTRLNESASATTSILLNPLEGNAFYPSTRGENLINLGTEAQALRSDAVAKMVVESTNPDAKPADLLGNLKVTNPSNTQILEVTYEASDTAKAIAHSQAFADAYLQYRQQKADDRIGGQIADLDEQIAAIQAQLAGLAGQFASVDENSVEAQVIRQNIQTLTDQLASLNARRADLESLPRDPGQVVTPAEADGAGPLNMKLLLLVAGAGVGFAGGLAIAMARTVSDRRIHGVGDIEVLDIPVLGVFGVVETAPTSASSSEGQWGISRAAEEQVRKIRATLLARQRRPETAVLVTGASDAGHAPLVVAELAASLARSGLETLVLHATLRAEEPRPLLRGPHPLGLGQLLLGRCSISDAIVSVGPMLSAVPVGELGEEVSDLFIGDAMRRLVHELKDRCDILLISADPIQHGTAQSLTSVVDGVVLEVDQHVTSRNELLAAVRTLGMLSADFDGAVLVGPEAEQWAQNFRPHLTMMQRELGIGTKMLLPGGPTPAPPPPADAEAARAAEQEKPAGAPSIGEPRPHQHSQPPSSGATPNGDGQPRQVPQQPTADELRQHHHSNSVRIRAETSRDR